MSRGSRITGVVALLALVWIVGTPPSAGPDEPVHLVRAAALVRGEGSGEPTELAANLRIIELPGTIGYPDHGCFSLQPLQPVGCAFEFAAIEADVPLGTTAWHYPIWGHLLPGLGTLVPGEAGNRVARIGDALVPILLLGAGLAACARRGPLAAASALMALTPMVWFSVAVVNPSGMAIAGGFALWCGLLGMRGPPEVPGRAEQWLVALGWAAAALPRRDGMLWAALAVAVWVTLSGVRTSTLLARLGRGPRLAVAASTVVTLVWAATNKTDSARLLVVAPLLPFAADAVRAGWLRPELRARTARALYALGLTVIAGIGAYVVMDRRSGGFDGSFLQRLIGQSGANFEEAIGILGWLDVPLPTSALFLWLIVLGLLAGASVFPANWPPLAGVLAVVAVAVPTVWVLEMAQGNETGTYFQGRYYLPLVVGIPLLLGHGVGAGRAPSNLLDPPTERRLAVVVTVAAVGLLTVAFAAGLRRWGVGIDGSIFPWRWDTYPTVLPPVVTLPVHAVLAVVLAREVLLGAAGPDPGPRSPTTVSVEPAPTVRSLDP